MTHVTRDHYLTSYDYCLSSRHPPHQQPVSRYP